MENRKILKKYYYAFVIRTASPLNISNGANDNSDSDVFVNQDGEVIVPGTSLAGSFRNYLDEYSNLNEYSEKNKSYFGYTYTYKDEANKTTKTESRMSSICISDLCLKNACISLRDNVKLAKHKTVDNKFDMEIVEPGASGTIYINYSVREKDDEKNYDDIIFNIISGINNGIIRLGKKKNRGFGLLQIDKVCRLIFNNENVDKYISFKTDNKNLDLYKDVSSEFSKIISEDKSDFVDVKDKYLKVSIPFNIPGGLIIREYSAAKGETDFSNVKSGGKPVIPGSSFAGIIKERSRRILEEIKCINPSELIDEWFGYVREEKESKDNNARQSDIVISESFINGGKELLRVRNSIDRFTNGAVDSALFFENVQFEGNVVLNILIRKKEHYEAIIGLLSLVIEDIAKGYVPIGGETNIGYGILTADYNELDTINSFNEYRENLFSYLKENGRVKNVG